MPRPVSVIIATRNRDQLLADTVESILGGDELPAEIVIVDQSDAPPVSLARRTADGVNVRHLVSLERGLSRARNEGAAAAREELFVFTDDDMRAHPGWLAALLSAAESCAEEDALSGRVLAGPDETPGAFVPALARRSTRAVHRGRLPIDVLAGGNMALRRTLFQRIGGFDVRLGSGSRFPAAEDNDLGFRLLEAGGSIVFVPEAVLDDRAWRNASQYMPLRHAYGRGKGGFYAKHWTRHDPHMGRRMIRDVMIRLARAPRRIATPRVAAGELAYAAGVIRGAVEWIWSARSAASRAA